VLAAILLAAPLAAFGQDAAKTVDWDEVVCRVNGTEIRRRHVEQEKQKVLPRATFHGKVDAARHQEMRRESLQVLIDSELEYQDARQRDVKVSRQQLDEALAEVIARYPTREAFDARMRGAGIEMGEVETSLRRQRMIVNVEEQVAMTAPEVSSDEVRAYYAERIDSMRKPRQAEVRRILISVPPLERAPEDWQAALDRAAAARARVEAGESFAEVASEVSDAPAKELAQGGLLGPVHPGQLEPQLDAVVWSVPEGGMSEPVVTFKGVVLLQVERLSPERTLEFDEVEERLRDHLQQQRREERLQAWRTELRAAARIEILDPALAPQPPPSPAS